MKNQTLIILLIILVVAVVVYSMYQKNKRVETTCFELPLSRNPQVFGSQYWKTFHTLAHKVPCVFCREFAEKFMVFFHDVVNMKTGKPIHDQQNFDKFTQLFADINKGENPFEAPITHE